MLAPHESIAFIGTYTGTASKGIYAYTFNSESGTLTPQGLAAETPNPSFLVTHPDGRFVYAVGEDDAGTVSAFAVGDRAKLVSLNTVSSRGSGPCHLTFDRTGRWLFVANYNSGSVAVFPVLQNGHLGEAAGFVQHRGASVDRQRQAGPHAHSVDLSPDNRFLVVNDLGLDQTLVYRFDAGTGGFTLNEPPFLTAAPGSGPRHLAFSQDGKFAWVLHELTATLSTVSFNAATGTFSELQNIAALPTGFTGSKSGAEIVLHPNGRRLYASNRGHDSIAVFSVDSRSGILRSETWTPTNGKTPRFFTLDPSGGYLLAANQNSGTIAIFKVDSGDGSLKPVGAPVEAPTPVSIAFAPIP